MLKRCESGAPTGGWNRSQTGAATRADKEALSRSARGAGTGAPGLEEEVPSRRAEDRGASSVWNEEEGGPYVGLWEEVGPAR